MLKNAKEFRLCVSTGFSSKTYTNMKLFAAVPMRLTL